MPRVLYLRIWSTDVSNVVRFRCRCRCRSRSSRFSSCRLKERIFRSLEEWTIFTVGRAKRAMFVFLSEHASQHPTIHNCEQNNLNAKLSGIDCGKPDDKTDYKIDIGEMYKKNITVHQFRRPYRYNAPLTNQNRNRIRRNTTIPARLDRFVYTQKLHCIPLHYNHTNMYTTSIFVMYIIYHH